MAQQLSMFDDAKQSNPRIVYFDLETLRSAEEVGGWSNISLMGMACGVCFDSIESSFSCYLEHQVSQLIQHLQRADLVVGFNHIRFDYTVLAGYQVGDLSAIRNFDLLDDLSRRLGHRLKLDSLVTATLGESKSADGMKSLQWVKEGRLDLVQDYCQQDVKVTRDIFLYGVHHQEVAYMDWGKVRRIKVDWDIHKLLGL